MRRAVTLAAVALVLLHWAPAFPARAIPPQPQAPALGAVLSPESMTVEAAYNDQDVVFSGLITLSNAPYAKYEVFLESMASQPWATFCSPGYLTFWGDGSAPFNVTVRVPRLAAEQTARVWVESRATYEDTDFAGNISGSVHVSVGKLPKTTGGNGSGDPFFGTVSGGGSPALLIIVALGVGAPAAVAMALAVRWWRRKRAGNAGNGGQ